jgi:hypothetical protein
MNNNNMHLNISKINKNDNLNMINDVDIYNNKIYYKKLFSKENESYNFVELNGNISSIWNFEVKMPIITNLYYINKIIPIKIDPYG